MKRKSPRAKLVDMLCDLGFAACEEDISWLRGAWAHVRFDVTHRWTATVVRVSDGKRVEITGTASISDCVKHGFVLEANPPDLYGDFAANLKTH